MNKTNKIYLIILAITIIFSMLVLWISLSQAQSSCQTFPADTNNNFKIAKEEVNKYDELRLNGSNISAQEILDELDEVKNEL